MWNRFALDRMEVPIFYTPKNRQSVHPKSFGSIFAESSIHHERGWICVGRVSKQSPFGQGIYMGFPKSELRIATKKEILAAIDLEHKFGENFHIAFSIANKEDIVETAGEYDTIMERWWRICKDQMDAIKGYKAEVREKEEANDG